jgi:hypothetical protein
MVTVAANSSPGVRVLDVGYPYIMDADSSTGISNDCTGDAAGGSWKGADSAVDAINDAVSAVSSSNAQYVSLTGTDGLGTDPEADGYIQLDRLYGFPHPTGGSGAQDRIANDAVTVLTGSGW